MIDQFKSSSIKECFSLEGFIMTETNKINGIIHNIRKKVRTRLQI